VLQFANLLTNRIYIIAYNTCRFCASNGSKIFVSYRKLVTSLIFRQGILRLKLSIKKDDDDDDDDGDDYDNNDNGDDDDDDDGGGDDDK